MKRNGLAAALLVWAALGAAEIQAAEWLVTPQEMTREQELLASGQTPPPPLRRRAVADGPELALLKPVSLSQPLKAPFPINLAFKPKDGAQVVPESFRALYGAFRLDITDRIVKHAKVGANGIDLDKAEIPSGSHRLVLQVRDDKNRLGETEIRFSVE